jgi:hypothetical protein
MDVWTFDPHSGIAQRRGSFPQTDTLFGALEGGYRISLSGIPNTSQFTAFGKTPTGQINFWHLNLGPQAIEQINICPVPIQPRSSVNTETSASSSPNGQVVITTIDSQNQFRTFRFTPNPVNVTEIWNGTTRRQAPVDVVGGAAVQYAGPNTLHQIFERPDGDLDFVETLLNYQGEFVSEKSKRIPADNVSGRFLSMSLWQLELDRPLQQERHFYGGVFNRSIKLLRMPGCPNADTQFCSTDNRFQVTVTWRDPQGNTGSGRAVPLTSDTGYFWFFNQANIELVIKVLDACIINQRFWVFAGGLTNVEVEIKVVDTETGTEKTYRNPQNTAFLPIQDTSAFPGCEVSKTGNAQEVSAEALQTQLDAINQLLDLPAEYFQAKEEAAPVRSQATCTPSSTQFCLNGNRFKVEADWEAPNGQRGKGNAVRLTDDSGYFWFFNASNVEMLTKVLNACNPFGAQWVFAAGLTNVKVELKVTDMQTGAVRRYENPQGLAFQPIQDTAAFTSCP